MAEQMRGEAERPASGGEVRQHHETDPSIMRGPRAEVCGSCAHHPEGCRGLLQWYHDIGDRHPGRRDMRLYVAEAPRLLDTRSTYCRLESAQVHNRLFLGDMPLAARLH